MDNLIFENTVVSIREITPENASRILSDKNTKNRRISPTKVAEYTSAMKRDEWAFNGDSIRLSSDGTLLDGQHRLTALVKAGMSQHFIVVENMMKGVGVTIDIGKNRSGGDVLSIDSGVSTGKAAAITGAIRLFYKHEIGRMLTNAGYGKLTNTQIVEQYEKHKKLIGICQEWMDENIKGQGAILPRSEMLAILMIFANIDNNACFSFAKMVFCGLGMDESCPQSLLRDYLLDCRSKVRKSDLFTRLHTIIKIWNSIRSGRKITAPRSVVFYKDKDLYKKAF